MTDVSERETSRARGLAARLVAPLESHAELPPATGRDAIGLLIGQDAARIPQLVPVRYGRMVESPFAFFRGAALPMAADLASTPASGLRAQLCGDAHLANFGAYASPERRLVFDLNDFDETLPGPFEWDLKRLIASIAVAGRANGLRSKQRRRVARAAAAMYRGAMLDFANQSLLDVWYARLDVEDTLRAFRAALSKGALRTLRADAARARSRDGMQALRKLTVVEGGRRRIVADPPLVIPLEDVPGDREADQVYVRIEHLAEEYALTLTSDLRQLLVRYRVSGLAHKVVGVGSVGTACWILLLEARDGSEPLLLQAKQAQRSVLADFAGESEHENQGERVVAGQRLMQAASDIFLGWQRAPVEGALHDYYLRQLRDWKFSVDLAALDGGALLSYARMCGWTLARAHARSGDRHALAAYLGETDAFDRAVTEFAEAYADLSEGDYAALRHAVAVGRVEARTGI